MLAVAETQREKTIHLSITCNKCGEKIAYIGSGDDRYTRQNTLEGAIRQHQCRPRLSFK